MTAALFALWWAFGTSVLVVYGAWSAGVLTLAGAFFAIALGIAWPVFLLIMVISDIILWMDDREAFVLWRRK